MSHYLRESPCSLGANWRKLVDGLKKLGFPDNQIDKLVNGRPIGQLILHQTDLLQISAVTHADSYFRWIRPLYIYNQGGWLSNDDCNELLESLIQIRENDLDESCREGIQFARRMLLAAMNNKVGLYMVILWDLEKEKSK